MGKCVEAWVFVHVPAVQLFNWTWHGTRNKQQQFGRFCFCLTFCRFLSEKKCFLFFSICRCWQACQIVRQIQRKAPSYRIFKMMIKQIAMVRMIIKYYWWLKVPSYIFQDLNCHQRYTHSRVKREDISLRYECSTSTSQKLSSPIFQSCRSVRDR